MNYSMALERAIIHQQDAAYFHRRMREVLDRPTALGIDEWNKFMALKLQRCAAASALQAQRCCALARAFAHHIILEN